jgi:hypothetical protein
LKECSNYTGNNVMEQKMETLKPGVFICYERKDLPSAQNLEKNFLAEGFQVWRDQGSIEPGEHWPDAIGQAIAGHSNQKALEIRTFQYLPYDWAQTQNNLANRENDPDVNAMFRLVENYFTAGLYTEGNRLITGLKPLLKDTAASQYLIRLEVFAAGNWAGLDDPAKASVHLQNLVSLVEKQPPDFKLDRNFPGSKYYIQTHPALEPHRTWLLSLFTALEKTGRDSILAQLKKLRPRERQSP